MTQKEILQKAIEKAQSNGFSTISFGKDISDEYMFFRIYYIIIFNHEFAEAFWQKGWGGIKMELWEKEVGEAPYGIGQLRWQYHLQQMVLEEEPITYLEKFISVNVRLSDSDP